MARAQVAYLQPDWGMPGARYFRCQPLASTLSTDACARNWRASLDQDSGGRLHKCRTCPVGAVHAGETAASLSPLRGAKLCARCQTGSTRIISGWLCVSCYNREREFVLQRNARGRPPVGMPPLHRRALRVIEDGEARTVDRGLTVDLAELMTAALRDSRRSVVFVFDGRPAARFGQVALW